MGRQLDINKMVLIGRTFHEYHRMFSLRDFQYPENEKILDAGGGVSSFTAEANASGWNVTSADQIYNMSPESIEQECSRDLDEVMKKLEPVKDLYLWEMFKDIPALKATREEAYRRFVVDYASAGRRKYVPVEFPGSDFKGGEFTLTLMSHFLFLYEKQIPFEEHVKILMELIRITSGEIRIFPVTNFEGTKSRFLDLLFEDPRFDNYKLEIKRVNYEFLKGANELLSIKPK